MIYKTTTTQNKIFYSQPTQGLQFNNIEVHVHDYITYIHMEKWWGKKNSWFSL